MSDGPTRARLKLGTAPDSWGVWFPDDPQQTTPERYLDEVRDAGYTWTELGPYGYLPTDPGALAEALDARGLTLTGSTVFVSTYLDAAALAKAKEDCRAAMATISPLGARHLIILPEGFSDIDGNVTGPTELTDDEWARFNAGMSELGRFITNELGGVLTFHTHADSHVGTHEQIERFLDGTDPDAVQLCLDTGHVAYYDADNVKLVRDYPERVAYVHLKQVDPAILARVRAESLGFAPAVRLGVMVEPPTGDPDMPELLDALAALDRDLYCIVEQDLYPCAPDVPLPIAKRTFDYFGAQGLKTRSDG